MANKPKKRVPGAKLKDVTIPGQGGKTMVDNATQAIRGVRQGMRRKKPKR